MSEPASSIGSPVMQRSKSRKASFQRLHAEMSSPASASSSFQLSRRGSGDPHDAAADHSAHLSFDNEVRFLSKPFFVDLIARVQSSASVSRTVDSSPLTVASLTWEEGVASDNESLLSETSSRYSDQNIFLESSLGEVQLFPN